MKKLINIRNSVIIILCITIVALGVGFICLSVELKNEKDKVHSFDVSIVNVSKDSAVKGSSIEPYGNVEVTKNGREIEMEFALNAIHDELTYIATLENKGTLPAEIVDVIESPDYTNDQQFRKLISPVSITLSDVEGKIIPAGEKMDFKILVYYNPTNEVVQKKKFNYRVAFITRSR